MQFGGNRIARYSYISGYFIIVDTLKPHKYYRFFQRIEPGYGFIEPLYFIAELSIVGQLGAKLLNCLYGCE